MNFTKANTLKTAFRACDVGPLTGENLDHYYVDLKDIRRTESINGVIQRLDFLESGEFSTVLFTGHRGCGKSTELRRIENRLAQDYRVIYLEADEAIDINDADYTDLYLMIINRVTQELYELGAAFDSTLLKNFESWFKEITDETEETVEKSVSLSTDAEAGFEIPFISKLIAKLQAQIKGANKQKTLIRQTLQKNIGRLKEDINALLLDAFKKLKQRQPQYAKGFLLILDNLDRVPPNVGNHLFFDYAAQIKGLNTTIIYTVPISVVYSGKGLSKEFDNPNIVPMVNLYQFEQDVWDLGYQVSQVEAFAEVIAQRVEIEAVFHSVEELYQLVRMSGGHVRQLMQMVAKACLTAATRGHNQILRDDVDYAIKQEQFNFERILLIEHFDVLAAVCRGKDINKDEVGQLLLFNTSVLEYNGDSRWNYVNPVIRESYAFQQAIAAV